MNDKSWYAIYTKPRFEKKVASVLAQKQINHYLPLQTTLKQWSDRKKKVEEPLFKSYLFVEINYEIESLRVLEIAGAVKFIRIGKELATIKPEIIQAIKISLSELGDSLTTSQTINPGEQVEVIGGALRGFSGIATAYAGNQYFALKIESLGTHLLVKVPVKFLKKR